MMHVRLSLVLRSFAAAALVVAASLVHPAAAGSPEVRRFNGGADDRASAIAVDLAGNVYVAGYTEEPGSQATFGVVKYTPQGAVDWVARYRGSAGGFGGTPSSVAVDAAGSVFVAGYAWVGTMSQSTLDFLLVKYDAAGVEQWARRYNGPGNNYDTATGVVVDGAGNAYVTGLSYDTSFDVATLKYGPDGTLLWTRRYTGPAASSDDRPVDAALDATGRLIVLTRTNNASGAFGGDMVLLAYDGAGNLTMQTRYTDTALSDESPAALDIDPEGNIVITGVLTATSSPEQEHFAVVVKVLANGQIAFAVKSAASGGGAIRADPFGNIYVTGASMPVFATNHSAVSKFDSTGALLWTTPLPEVAATTIIPYLLDLDAAGNAYATGHSFTPMGMSRDIRTIKVTSDGVRLWDHQFNGTGNRDDTAAGVAVSAAGDVYVAGTAWNGYVSSGGTANDMMTLKFPGGGAPTGPEQPPAAPSNLRTDTVTATRVALRWTDNAADESGYRIERCQGSSTCTSFATLAELPANTVTYMDTSVARNTSYRYRVRAFNAAGASAVSNVVAVKTPKK